MSMFNFTKFSVQAANGRGSNLHWQSSVAMYYQGWNCRGVGG